MTAFVEVKEVHQTYPVTWSLLRWMRQVVYQRERRGRPQDSLQGVNLSVEAGTILGLVGPANSGKSTLLRVVAGLLRPTRGEVWIGGEELFKARARLASRIGYVVREPRSFRAALSPKQNLNFFAGMAGLQGSIGARRVEELMEGFGLVEVAGLPCRLLSEGTLRRLSVARALLTQPELLVMDEETAGLDPIHRSEFYGFLSEHVRQTGCTVLYATHNLNEAQFLCDEVALMDQGKVIAQGRYLEVSEVASGLFLSRGDQPDPRASLYPQQTDLRQTRRRQSERW